MHHDTDLINIVAVGLGLAFILGALANKLRLSPLVGYLVAGICVGPFTPGFVADQALANQLAEIGVMLLMFGVGLHFSLKDLMAVKAIAIPGAIGQILVATLLGWGLAWLMGWPVIQGVVFGFSLATASTVVLLRAMEERRLLETQRGKIAVGWLIVEDLACVLALVMMPVLAGVFGPDAAKETHTVGSVLASIGWTFVQLGLFVAVMLVVGRRVIPWILERIAATGSRELFTLSVLAIALGVAFGSAMLFGVSGRVLRRHAAQRIRAQPQGRQRFAAAARCVRGAVLRFRGHAVQPGHPDRASLAGAGHCGDHHVRQVRGCILHRARVWTSQRHRADHFGQPGADRRIRLHHRRPRR